MALERGQELRGLGVHPQRPHQLGVREGVRGKRDRAQDRQRRLGAIASGHYTANGLDDNVQRTKKPSGSGYWSNRQRSRSRGITSRAKRSSAGFIAGGSMPGGTPKPISCVNGSRSW